MNDRQQEQARGLNAGSALARPVPFVASMYPSNLQVVREDRGDILATSFGTDITVR
jgi:hypothetical protein